MLKPWQKKLRVIVFSISGLGLILWFSAFIWPPIPEKITYSTLITDSRGQLLHAFLSSDDKWRMKVTAPEVTPLLRSFFLAKEDTWFYYHPGVNPLAVGRAVLQNVVSGRRMSGASTLSMQVIRLANPAKRTYASKLLEMVRAMQLELHYSKEEIFQLYLNLVPYGSNIEGVKAASHLYFRKSPDRLSAAEMATLAIIPNRPTTLLLGRRNELIQQERNRWLGRFKTKKLLSHAAYQQAIAEPLAAKRSAPPQLAPHLSIRLQQQNSHEPLIRSTLRSDVQANAEKIIENYVAGIRGKNIQNAAAYIIDNQLNEVVAYVGSADFGNPSDGGQVDGVRAVRSPGSALKPFLYAIAFEQGLLTPKVKLADVPINLSGFQPTNFDEKFNGLVTAHFALANSLNIPAVEVLNQVGTQQFIERLKPGELETIRKQQKSLGLSMILGGCGVTLEELTNLYTSLANSGNFSRPKFLQNSEQMPQTRLFSAGAVSMITDILSTIQRPDLPSNFDYTFRLPKIAWKTGTSFGRRDAWSIGYSPRFTIGVWVGNFSGIGVPELSGADTATPLLFALFNAIDYNQSGRWFARPAEVKTRAVCAETGLLPNKFCTNRVLDTYLEGKSSTKVCHHLKTYFVNATGSIHFCTHCLPPTGVQERLYANLPPAVVAYYRSKGVAFQEVPPHNPQCRQVRSQAAQAPIITSPNQGSTYYIEAADPQKLGLSCQTTAAVQWVYWYIDGQLLTKSAATQTSFWQPSPGVHTISCIDEFGQKSSVQIEVKSL